MGTSIARLLSSPGKSRPSPAMRDLLPEMQVLNYVLQAFHTKKRYSMRTGFIECNA